VLVTLVAVGVLLAAGGIRWALASGDDPKAPATTESTGGTADEAAATDALSGPSTMQ